ncbi:MAG: hypothetical protein EPN79_15920 [Burkholderiaceae bacterium]|nr:MAG: hypothetical protein EPN79_15920 [Burkholderiaceae bacterium]
MTEPKKAAPTSIWPGPALLTYLARLGPRSRKEGVSLVVDRMAARYLHVLQGAIPAWRLDDWCVAMEALRDHQATTPASLQVLGLVIQAAAEHKRFGSSPGRDASTSDFAYQAKRLSEAGQVAVAEVVEGYWRRHGVMDRDALRTWLVDVGAPGIEPIGAP